MAKLPDSGKRSKFVTGAVRDSATGKGFFSDIPPIALRAIAKRFEAGAKKYKRGNYRKGMPLSRCFDSTMRHLIEWAEGKTNEDHGGAVLWNMAVAMWTEEEIQLGRLPKSLDDLPYRHDASTKRRLRKDRASHLRTLRRGRVHGPDAGR